MGEGVDKERGGRVRGVICMLCGGGLPISKERVSPREAVRGMVENLKKIDN